MQLKEDVLQAHQTQPYRSPLSVRTGSLRNRIVVDVDHAIEHRNRHAHSSAKFLEVESRPTIGTSSDMPRQIDRAQITNRGLRSRSHLRDLRAQIRKVNDIPRLTRLIALQVGSVLESHPAIPGLGERPHHPRIKITRLNLPQIKLVTLSLLVSLRKRSPDQVRQLRNIHRIEQRPHTISLNPLHEQVRNP